MGLAPLWPVNVGLAQVLAVLYDGSMRGSYGTAECSPVRVFETKITEFGITSIIATGRLIQGADRVPYQTETGTGSLAPSEIEVQYVPEGQSWSMSCVTVTGRRIERDGHPGRVHCKVVYWVDTLGNAPGWVRDFVTEHTPAV